MTHDGAVTGAVGATLTGKRAFVTAAGAGIGRATALAFAAQGAEVIATDIDASSLEGLAVAQAHALDVTDADAVNAMAESVGGVDILFNCAGFVHHGSILDCDPEAFDFSLGLNVKSMYTVTRSVLPGMLERGGGSIISMSSALGSIIAAPNRFVYGATKAAVIGMTKAIAADFVTQGVRANAICPGTVESPSWHERVKAAAAEAGSIEAARDAFVARQPMGRIAQPEEIAGLAVYLASDVAAYVTGQAIAIDGGWSNT